MAPQDAFPAAGQDLRSARRPERERTTAASIRASVCMLSSQSPMRATNTNAANTVSAGRGPPKRNTTITPAGHHARPGEPEQHVVDRRHQPLGERPEAVEDREGDVRVLGRALAEQPGLELVQALRQLGPGERLGPGQLVAPEPEAEQHHGQDRRHLRGPPAPAGAGTRQRRRADPAASDRHPEPRTWRPGSLHDPRSPRCGRSPPHAPAGRTWPPGVWRPSRRSTRRAAGRPLRRPAAVPA